MRHVGEELGLVLRRERELLGLFLDRAARHLDLDILPFDLLLLVLEELRLFLKLLVGRVQLLLLAGQLGLAGLKLLRQQLRLLKQALGAHRRGDRVQHDADRFHQLVEEALVGLVELVERGQLDNRLHFILEQGRKDADTGRLGMAEARADTDEVRRNVLEQDRPAIRRRLADQAFAQVELLLQLVLVLGAIARNQLQLRFILFALGDVEHAILRVHQRRELDMIRFDTVARSRSP